MGTQVTSWKHKFAVSQSLNYFYYFISKLNTPVRLICIVGSQSLPGRVGSISLPERQNYWYSLNMVYGYLYPMFNSI